jgi:hypothetical protein
MEYCFAIGASAASAETRNDLVERQLVADDSVKAHAVSREQLLERFGLGYGPGKTIQQKSSRTFEASHALGNQGEHGFIGDKLAASHVL